MAPKTWVVPVLMELMFQCVAVDLMTRSRDFLTQTKQKKEEGRLEIID